MTTETKFKLRQPLPALRSALIRLALRDLELVEVNPAYKVDMGTWHGPSVREDCECEMCVEARRHPIVCQVCFAGAIMAIEDGLTSTQNAEPSDFDEAAQRSFLFLDRIRKGVLPIDFGELSFDVTPYATNPELFKLEMELTAECFAQLGQ